MKGEVKEGSNGKDAWSNDASRCIHHRIASLHFPSTHSTTDGRPRKERKQRKNACTFFSFFCPSLSFLPEQPARKERVKGDAVSQPARVSPRSYLSLPAFLPPLLFCLRSKTRQETDGEDKRGCQEEKVRCAIASLMIT